MTDYKDRHNDEVELEQLVKAWGWIAMGRYAGVARMESGTRVEYCSYHENFEVEGLSVYTNEFRSQLMYQQVKVRTPLVSFTITYQSMRGLLEYCIEPEEAVIKRLYNDQVCEDPRQIGRIVQEHGSLSDCIISGLRYRANDRYHDPESNEFGVQDTTDSQEPEDLWYAIAYLISGCDKNFTLPVIEKGVFKPKLEFISSKRGTLSADS